MYIVMRSQVVTNGLYKELNNISDRIYLSDKASNLTLFNNTS